MYLPDELVLEVLPHLHNTELKTARLVCRRWSCYAAESLFSKIFISPDQVNLDVFRSICNHPLLSRCVRHLQYDRLHLKPNIELSEYTNALFRETRDRLQYSEERPIETDDIQRTEFYTIVKNSSRGQHDREYHPALRRRAKAKCMTFDFIRTGFQRYVTQAQLQKRFIDGTDIESIIEDGLKTLDHLDAVTISDAGLRPELGTGSVLSRSWKSQSDWPSYVFESEPHAQAYPMISDALLKAQKHIHHLQLEGTVGDTVCNVMNHDSPSSYYAFNPVYRELKTLRLTLEVEYPLSMDDGYLYYMHEMLRSMLSLQDLRLAFVSDESRRVWKNPSAIFPDFGQWTQLTKLTLENMTFSTTGLLELIVLRMPSLQHLTLSGIGLVGGKWESVFEFLHCANILQSLRLFDRNIRCLPTRERQWYWWGSIADDIADVNNKSRDNIARMFEDYVVGSRHNPAIRHPSLQPHQPKEESQQFLADLFSNLETKAGGPHGELLVRMHELIEDDPTHQ